MNHAPHPSVLGLLTILALGCGGAGSSEAPVSDGEAPTISALSYAPNETLVGSKTILIGSFTFADVDADLTELAIEITAPGSSAPTSYPPTSLAASQAGANGTVSLSVTFVPPAAGDYAFAVRAVDAKGHASNPLTGSVKAR